MLKDAPTLAQGTWGLGRGAHRGVGGLYYVVWVCGVRQCSALVAVRGDGQWLPFVPGREPGLVVGGGDG